MYDSVITRRPLLSICIPTYNRKDILIENLTALAQNSSFNNEIQIVIGDNASTDGTQEIVENFITRNQDKNIKYYKNNSNIKDRNFLKVLQAGDGIYCKLLNDYTKISEYDLSMLIETVRRYQHAEPSEMHLGFFYRINNNSISNEEIEISDINQYILTLHNKMTWTSNFGCFRDQLMELNQYEQYSDLLMLQLFWTLHLAKTRKFIIVCNLKDSQNIPVPNSKRSDPYNFFTPHVVNYYKAINHFTSLSSRDLRFDKTKILSDFVGDRVYEYLVLKKDSPFDLKGSWKILLKYFYNVPYFYILIPIRISKSILSLSKRLIRWMIKTK